jgi:uncharacterized protein YpmB
MNFLTKIFCNHEYELKNHYDIYHYEDEMTYIVTGREKRKTGEEQIYICKKCLKVKRVKI